MTATAPNIYPCLRYKDAKAAMAWLEQAFGFAKRVAYDTPDGGPDGGIGHAEMSFGAGMIMLGTLGNQGVMADIPHGPQCLYVVVADDIAGHYARAKAAGARIVRELAPTDYGSTDYCALDPEGNFWSFGTYWPKADEPA